MVKKEDEMKLAKDEALEKPMLTVYQELADNCISFTLEIIGFDCQLRMFYRKILTFLDLAFAKVGEGRLGYIGDVNNEQGSQAVILSMLELAANRSEGR
jgi:hypothetical protein